MNGVGFAAWQIWLMIFAWIFLPVGCVLWVWVASARRPPR